MVSRTRLSYEFSSVYCPYNNHLNTLPGITLGGDSERLVVGYHSVGPMETWQGLKISALQKGGSNHQHAYRQ